MTKDFITNHQGAKIFISIDNQPKLVIPGLDKNRNKGKVLEVLDVGFHDINHTPMVTIRKNKAIIAYLLPDWYRDWADLNMVHHSTGTTPFPCNIEFGFIPEEERYYAEFI
ncbi:MAG TPA: hypothetical protein VN426_04235 [Syntrophomonadaceae bacterium]|nr:hypothetical protein [Syntrophomonadaceae bacterium]